MGDADDTYPLSELPPFVERLEPGDDLVIGSRFKGTIHGDAMPFLNRFVGNPVLTGMLNVLFGVKVSDAHCGMRALRREALPVLDLHSTGMEFASEMVFKAYRRGLTVSEVPIDYYPRVGESKLNRFGDAWRHVRFMLLYSPSWLYLLPGSVLLLLGLIGMIVLAAGPTDILGHTWQIHTMLGFVALTLIGAQVIQLGVFARTYARVRIGERDLCSSGSDGHLRSSTASSAGGLLVLSRVVGLGRVGDRMGAERLRHPRARVRDGPARDRARARDPDRLRRLLPRPAHDAAASRDDGNDLVARTRDLGRHPGEGRGRRPRAVPRGDLAPARRRRGRGRRRRLWLARRQRRARAALRRARARDPAGRVPTRPHAQRRRRARPRGDARLHEPGRLRGDRPLARHADRAARSDERVAGVYGRQLPHDDATPPERYFLDFLYGPDARVQRLGGRRRAHVRADALLERELRDSPARLGGSSRSPTTS